MYFGIAVLLFLSCKSITHFSLSSKGERSVGCASSLCLLAAPALREGSTAIAAMQL